MMQKTPQAYDMGKPAEGSAPAVSDLSKHPRPSPVERRGTGLGNLLRETELAFSKAFRRELAAFGVTVAQYQHLRRLWEEDGITQAELSRSIGVENASSTATLDSLERQALIHRSRNSRDRRKVNVFLTPTGAALEADLIACARRTNDVATGGLDRGDVEELFRILRQVSATLRGADTETS